MAARTLTARVCSSGLFLCLVFCCVGLGATKKPPLKPINLNSATSEELQQVPGIGPATADKILPMRKSYGAFKSVDDLLAIRGIGKKRLDKMRKYLTTGKTATPNKSVQPANCAGCGKALPVKRSAAPANPHVPAEADATPKPTAAEPAATEPGGEPEEPRL